MGTVCRNRLCVAVREILTGASEGSELWMSPFSDVPVLLEISSEECQRSTESWMSSFFSFFALSVERQRSSESWVSSFSQVSSFSLVLLLVLHLNRRCPRSPRSPVLVHLVPRPARALP